jgi:putative inorganic carbon (hco3(-)) transporter
MTMLFAGAICVAVLALLLINPGPVTIAAAVLMVLGPLVIIRPYYYIIIFILLRPSMDAFANVQAAEGGMNPAAYASMLLIAVGSVILVRPHPIDELRKSAFLRWCNFFMILFFAVGILGVMNSSIPGRTASDLIRFLTIVIMVNYASVYFSGIGREKVLILCILGSALIPLSFGMMQLITRRGALELGYNRVFGTFVHPNVFAEYLFIVFFVIWFCFSAYRLRKWKGALLLLMGAVTLLLLFSTYTRGVWIALVISSAAYVLLKNPLAVKLKQVAAILCVAAVAAPFVIHRFSDIHTNTPTQLSSWEWRLQQWRRSAGTVLETPVLGHGLGMYEEEFTTMAHSDYLRTAYETGFAGLCAYLALIGFVFIASLRRMRRCIECSEAARFKLVFCLTLGIMVMSGVDNLARSTAVLMLYFLLVGAMMQYRPRPGGVGEEGAASA